MIITIEDCVQGMYWGITAMHLMRSLNSIDHEVTVEFVKKCQHENGIIVVLKGELDFH